MQKLEPATHDTEVKLAVSLADGLSRDGGDALEQRHAARQIAAPGEHLGAPPVGPEQHVIADAEAHPARGGQHTPKADRRAGRGIPDHQRPCLQR